MKQRDIQIRRIRALMAKTKDTGATEAEALAAAEKVGHLLDLYGLSMFDVEQASDGGPCYVKKMVEVGNRRSHEVVNVAVRLAEYCDVKVWVGHSDKGKVLCYFGLEPDAEVAEFLTKMLKQAFDSSWREFQKTASYRDSSLHGRTVRANFMAGMAHRLNVRLQEMIFERAARQFDEGTNITTGKQLVVVKSKAVEEAFQKQIGIKLRTTKKRYGGRRADQNARAAGRRAADRVNFNQAVRGDQRAALA